MSQHSPGPSRPIPRPPRILIVDDDDLLLRVLRRVLQSVRSDWQVVTAMSTEEGMALLESQHIDVIVVDARLQGLPSTVLLDFTRAHHPRVIRVVHGPCDPSDAVGRLAQLVVPKPTHTEQLLACLDEAVARRDHVLAVGSR